MFFFTPPADLTNCSAQSSRKYSHQEHRCSLRYRKPSRMSFFFFFFAVVLIWICFECWLEQMNHECKSNVPASHYASAFYAPNVWTAAFLMMRLKVIYLEGNSVCLLDGAAPQLYWKCLGPTEKKKTKLGNTCEMFTSSGLIIVQQSLGGWTCHLRIKHKVTRHECKHPAFKLILPVTK